MLMLVLFLLPLAPKPLHRLETRCHAQPPDLVVPVKSRPVPAPDGSSEGVRCELPHYLACPPVSPASPQTFQVGAWGKYVKSKSGSNGERSRSVRPAAQGWWQLPRGLPPRRPRRSQATSCGGSPAAGAGGTARIASGKKRRYPRICEAGRDTSICPHSLGGRALFSGRFPRASGRPCGVPSGRRARRSLSRGTPAGPHLFLSGETALA